MLKRRAKLRMNISASILTGWIFIDVGGHLPESVNLLRQEQDGDVVGDIPVTGF
jgi:hypothetical protein